MNERTITTQKQLDALQEVKEGQKVIIDADLRLNKILNVKGTLIINNPLGCDINGDRYIKAYGSATVRAWGSATVRASDSAIVRASGSATVRAWGSATVEAYGSATVEAYGSATVEAYGSATVRASDSAIVRASDSAIVRAWGSATVEAYGSATVRAWGSATVRASDSAIVRASDSATVRASDSAIVRAWGSATVEAYGSAIVRASDSAIVEASDSAIVRASDSATVTLFGFSMAIYFPSVTLKIKSDFAKAIEREQVFKIKRRTLVYKKLKDNLIATLELQKGAIFQSENNSKCRTASAKVVKIEDKSGNSVESGASQHNEEFIYRVGEVVSAKYDENIKECSTGIHFFLDRESAERY